jgi:hypothetical protein
LDRCRHHWAKNGIRFQGIARRRTPGHIRRGLRAERRIYSFRFSAVAFAAGRLTPATSSMDQAQLNWITNFIWNIADDILRDKPRRKAMSGLFKKIKEAGLYDADYTGDAS